LSSTSKSVSSAAQRALVCYFSSRQRHGSSPSPIETLAMLTCLPVPNWRTAAKCQGSLAERAPAWAGAGAASATSAQRHACSSCSSNACRPSYITLRVNEPLACVQVHRACRVQHQPSWQAASRCPSSSRAACAGRTSARIRPSNMHPTCGLSRYRAATLSVRDAV
jgi:hypothetical protein